MTNLIKSIFLLLTISCGIAAPFSKNLTTFLMNVVFVCIIQIIGYNCYNSWKKLQIQREYTKRIAEYSKQGVTVSCPCSENKKLFIPIRLNEDNSFKCLECKKNVAVAVNVKTFLSTQPVDLDKSDIALNDVYNKIVEEEKTNGISI